MKPRLNLWQIICMSVGFFGIQHGFSIQFARMSSIYEKLGATPDQIPFLWLAAPMTGLIIQPIIGYLSDRTWGRLGRRRPYFLSGAVLATIALVLMPNSSSVWMAAGMLWILDASINISMEPFRAFVADKLPQEQVATGYAMQTVMIGIGGALGFWIASKDWLVMFPSLSSWIPSSMHMQFYICAIMFLGGVIYTVSTSGEYPPEDMAAFKKHKKENSGIKHWAKTTYESFIHMPGPMKRLAWVQLFSWMGLFCMWIFYSVAVAHHVFKAYDPHSSLYEVGIRTASSSMTVYQIVSTAFALLIPLVARKIGSVYVHTIGLISAGIGLLSIYFISDPSWLYVSMVGVGIGWATILCMPYAILVRHIPKEKYGIYMGIFNMFIVIPEIISSLLLGWFMR
ncbi:MAG: MFS transporter, partial [Proteobacteria bacterium]|nr:MFS transporter [Pseudomonadota bacterium]